MSIGILGKKLGMSQFFDDKGRSVPVTLIEAGPCRITQLKTIDTEGYSAVQIGFGDVREKLINRPSKGHLSKSGEEFLRHLKEYRVANLDGLELGTAITGLSENDFKENFKRYINQHMGDYRKKKVTNLCNID